MDSLKSGSESNDKINKIAFQWDAHRPRVDRISQYAMKGGVSALGGICSGGVSAPGGCLLLEGLLPGGVSAPGGVSQHALRQTPPLLTE